MELLVHISAPTSRASDKRFESQASAYMSFEPTTAVDVWQASEQTDTITKAENNASVTQIHPREPSVERSRISEGSTQLTGWPSLHPSWEAGQHHLSTPHMITIDAPQPDRKPMSSPFEQLELLQSNWRSTAASNRPVPITLLAESTVVESSRMFDTQFAVSAIESQLATQPTYCHPGRRILSPINPEHSVKRRRIMGQAQSAAETDLSVESSMLSPKEANDVDNADRIHHHSERLISLQQLPRTPEPESLGSVLPSDYMLSDTTTETPVQDFGTRSQQTGDPSTSPYPPGTFSIRTEKGQSGRSIAQHTETSTNAYRTTHKDAVNASAAIQDALTNPEVNLAETTSSIRQPLHAIEPNSSPPKQDKASYEPPCHPERAVPAKLSQPKQPTVRDFALPNQQQKNNTPAAVTASTNQRTRQLSTPAATTHVTFSQLPLDAHAPLPPTGVTRSLPSQITSKLQRLADIPLLASRYNPTKISRNLAAHERGRWEFTIRPSDAATSQAWPLDHQIKFWESLCRLVTDGSLGFYTWCIRQPVSTEGEPVLAGTAISSGGGDEALGRVRVFCWGEVARHVWLLLYSISDNKIRKADVRWIDSKGEAVIEMPMHKQLV